MSSGSVHLSLLNVMASLCTLAGNQGALHLLAASSTSSSRGGPPAARHAPLPPLQPPSQRQRLSSAAAPLVQAIQSRSLGLPLLPACSGRQLLSRGSAAALPFPSLHP